MTVKRSVSFHDDLDAFAQEEVRSGRNVSLSSVVHDGLMELKEKRRREARERAEEEAFFDMLRKRAEGPFVSAEEFWADTEKMIAEKRRALGLDG